MASSKTKTYLGGATILAATVALTKIIGAIYKIPLFNLLGDEGTAHFQVTYTIYNLLLTISTAGIPVALSRLISSARATDRPVQARRYFSVGMAVFGIVGVVGALCMFFWAQGLADLMGDPEVAGAVRCLAPAVFFACVISVFRGLSQGHGDMLPTSISQIMEVGCKLVFGLTIAWFLDRRGYGTAAVAAGAIVGVTIGLGLAIPIVWAYCRRLGRDDPPAAVLDEPDPVSSTCRQIISIGVPITLGSSILNIITLIDTKLVLLRLQSGAGFSYTDAKILYGAYSKALTLFNIPSAFLTPVAVAVVPAIAAALAAKNALEGKKLIESSIKITNLLALPAGVGLCVLCKPIYTVLYPNSNAKGPALLAILGIASYFVCTYLVTNAALQASGHEKLSLITLPIGGVIKIGVNWILVGSSAVNILGAPVGTLACYIFITLMNVVFMSLKLRDSRPDFLKITVKPVLCTAAMAAAAAAVSGLCTRFLAPALGGGRMGGLVSLVAAVGAAVAVYGVLIIVTRTFTREDALLLPKGETIARLLKLK